MVFYYRCFSSYKAIVQNFLIFFYAIASLLFFFLVASSRKEYSMKKFAKKIISLSLMITMLFCCTFSAFAAEKAVSADVYGRTSTSYSGDVALYSNTYPYTSSTKALTINSSAYKRLAYSNTGFNCYVKIRCSLNGLSNRGSVILKGKSGNTLWTTPSTDYVPSHGSYTYWCGSDVYSIWIKTTSGFGTAWVEK